MSQQPTNLRSQFVIGVICAIVGALTMPAVNFITSSLATNNGLEANFYSAPSALPPTQALQASRFDFDVDIARRSSSFLDTGSSESAKTPTERDTAILDYIERFGPEQYFGILELKNQSRHAIEDVSFLVTFEGVALVRETNGGTAIQVDTSQTMTKHPLGTINPGQSVSIPIWFDGSRFSVYTDEIKNQIMVLVGSGAIGIDYKAFDPVHGPSPFEEFLRYLANSWLFLTLVFISICLVFWRSYNLDAAASNSLDSRAQGSDNDSAA